MDTKEPKASENKINKIGLFSLFGGLEKVNPHLDKAKESVAKKLRELKEQGKLKDTAASIFNAIKTGFIEDLDELNITGDKRKKALEALDAAWKEHQEGRVSKEIGDSFELKDMNTFIDKLEELDPLVDEIANYKPTSQLGSFIENLTKKFPSLKPYASFIGSLLTMFGLGSLKDKIKEKGTKKDTKGKGKKKPETKKGKEVKVEGPKETLADMPENYVPKETTLFVGDSNLDGNPKLKFKKGDKIASQAGEQTGWGLRKIKGMKEHVNNYGNIILGFGGNDLGAKEPYEILANYKLIVEQVRRMNKKRGDNFRTKIFIVTTPPVGDGTKVKLNGNWGKKPQKKSHKATNDKRNKLNQMIRDAKARNEFNFDEVIDMAATVKNGGVSNEELTAMEKDLNRQGDPVHVKASEYAKRIRFGIYLSDKKDGDENDKGIA